MRGLSIMVSTGKYAGFGVELATTYPITFRVVLGWISFMIIGVDLERLLHKSVTDANRAKTIEKTGTSPNTASPQ